MWGIPASFIFSFSAGSSSSAIFLTCAEASLIGGFDDIVWDFRCVRFTRILLPLLSRGLQRCLYSFDYLAIFICALGHGIELIDYFAARRAVGRRNHHARILFGDDFLRGLFVSGLDLDGVFPRFAKGSGGPKADPRGDGFLLFGRRLRRRIRA